jgi:hypothetical protein
MFAVVYFVSAPAVSFARKKIPLKLKCSTTSMRLRSAKTAPRCIRGGTDCIVVEEIKIESAPAHSVAECCDYVAVWNYGSAHDGYRRYQAFAAALSTNVNPSERYQHYRPSNRHLNLNLPVSLSQLNGLKFWKARQPGFTDRTLFRGLLILLHGLPC